jgi:hypothetical protein
VQNTRPPVFDERERTATAPAANEESSFEFLNRIAGDYWEHPRQLIETWASHLPDDAEYSDIRSRLRSRNNSQFNSAFLELYLHETLLRTGHTVTIHPTLEHTTRRPDFYAEKNGTGFYVEAIAPGASKESEATAARRNRFLDVVNRLQDPNFYLWLHTLDIGPGEPAAARLRSELKRWLAKIDPDTVIDYTNAPRFRWERQGWVAEFSAVPLRSDARGQDREDRRAIAVYADQEAGWVDDANLITKALGTKHREYGTLDKPFLIAIGLFIFDADRWHAMNAFFGHERLVFDSARAYREGDGYFGSPPRWQNTNVSGVLLVNQLQPYHAHKADVSLWIHPGAEHELPDAEWPGDSMTLVNDRVITTPAAVAASDLFGLEEPWPPGEAWRSR